MSTTTQIRIQAKITRKIRDNELGIRNKAHMKYVYQYLRKSQHQSIKNSDLFIYEFYVILIQKYVRV